MDRWSMRSCAPARAHAGGAPTSRGPGRTTTKRARYHAQHCPRRSGVMPESGRQ
jgi:hypothetical protein